MCIPIYTHVSEAFYFMSVYTNDFELYPLNDIITVYETSAYILISRKRLVCIVWVSIVGWLLLQRNGDLQNPLLQS